MTFVWVHVIWFGTWVFVNALPGLRPFDPFPFTFLTLIVSLEAIFLSTFIFISQNHETRLSERRNQLDLQINLLTEQENTKMLRMLERIARADGLIDQDWVEGFEACGLQEGPDSCPYDDASEQFNTWVEGWMAAAYYSNFANQKDQELESGHLPG